MTLSWTRVERSRNERGEKVYPSGIPKLTDKYLDQLEEIEKEKAERKESGIEEIDRPNVKRRKTLSTYFNEMKQDFREIKDWMEEPQGREQKYYKDKKTGRERKIAVAVQKWPEPDFDDVKQENDKVNGMYTVAEKRRWHHRSKYEAVYACDAEEFNEEMDKRRRQGRPRNSNMEALGRDREPRGNANTEAIGIRTRPIDQRENLLPPSVTRRSPARDVRSERSINVEGEERGRDERFDRESRRSGVNGFDRYSRSGPDNEYRRERSPRDRNGELERREYDRNRSQERPRSPPPMSRGPRTPPPPQSNYIKSERSPSPRSRYDDRARRSPERDSYSSSLKNYQQMRENPSPREMPSLQNSRRESYEYDDRRGRSGDVKRERV